MTPKIGDIYRHYKSTGGNNYTYEIIGIGKHTETEELFIIYKPLYKSDWHEGCNLTIRPLSMWNEMLKCDERMVPRFTLITEKSASND